MTRPLLAFFFIAAMMPAADLTITAGVQITPDKTANAGLYQQQSRPGPSVGIGYGYWFTSHHGLVFGMDYGNTDTRLADFAANNWTMNRLSFDGAYEYRWSLRKLSPFVKVGLGSLVTLSGQAPGHIPVGLDGRLEELAGVGVSYRLSSRFTLLGEYECHFFRNPDFTDHAWHPQRNEVSEPKLGITYTFGKRG